MNVQRGPTACGIDAMPLLNWGSRIISEAGSGIDHVISVVGWSNDASKGQYWIEQAAVPVRSSSPADVAIFAFVPSGLRQLLVREDALVTDVEVDWRL